MNKNRQVWINGIFVDEGNANISIYDSALMFGDMVFEMTRSFNKEQFKLREHIDRLFASARFVRIPLNLTEEELEAAVYETIEKNEPLFEDDDEHRIMINITRGILGIYQGVEGLEAGTKVIIADFPLRWTVATMGPLFDEGINAVITSQRAIPASLLEPKVKNRSRLHYMMANVEAGQMKGKNNWALLLDPDGFIAEGTGDNFFIVKDGIIYTPEPRNILRGISRDYIFELSKELGLECIEKNIEPFDVYQADEAFMTGTPFSMLPVLRLNSLNIGDGKVGPVFSKLIDRWNKNVGVDIVAQIKDWDANGDKKNSSGVTPYSFGSEEN